MKPTSDRETNHALRARFIATYGQYEQLRAGLAELRQRLGDLCVTEESADGQVRATVGARGQLMELVLHPDIYRQRDADGLAAKITRTVQHAADEAGMAVHELVTEYLPDSSGAAEFLRDNDFGALLRRHEAPEEASHES